MTVPWVYVGMLFSTFCWHNEDHYTYSINYQHYGSPKTWYGIPGSQAEKFELLMQKDMPDLFKHDPNLFSQLTTISNPFRFSRKEVDVYTTDQNPREFIITFPKAYHAGFNQGFNFNEAVNFAPPDWLLFGKEAAEKYAKIKKNPTFSHEQLVLNYAYLNNNIQSVKTIIPQLESILKYYETKLKHENICFIKKRRAPYNEPQCYFCYKICFVSALYCTKNKRTFCLDHIENVISECNHDKELLIFVEIEHIKNTLNKNRLLALNNNNLFNEFEEHLNKKKQLSLKTIETYVKRAKVSNQLHTCKNMFDYYKRCKSLSENIAKFIKSTFENNIEPGNHNSIVLYLREAEMLCFYSEETTKLAEIYNGIKTKNF